MPLTLAQLQAELKPWQEHNFGPHPSWHPLLGLVEEVGELSHAHLKKEQQIRISEDHDANKRDAVADIMIYLADYCNNEGIDLQTELEKTWSRVKQRDWKASPSNAHQVPTGK